MGEVVLTPEERDIKNWAGLAFKRPWVELVQKCSKIKRGEKLQGDEILYHPFFVNIFIDVRLVYQAMKAFKISRFVSGNLFTIILSSREDRVIWACFEREEDGVFTELTILDPTEEWSSRMASLLFIDNLKGAYELALDVIKQKRLAGSLGAIKVANIMFFKAIKDAYEGSSEAKNLPLFLTLLSDAIKTIIEKRWIRFYPNVPLYKLINLSYPILKGISPVNKLISKVLSLKLANDMLVAYQSYLTPIRISL